jgi:hypothetical protein
MTKNFLFSLLCSVFALFCIGLWLLTGRYDAALAGLIWLFFTHYFALKEE